MVLLDEQRGNSYLMTNFIIFLEILGERAIEAWIKAKQGNRGDMWKIHVTRQFFEATGRHGDFFEKTKKPIFR